MEGKIFAEAHRGGPGGYLFRWMQSYLTDRIVMLEVGEHTREVLTSCGVPQGSPLSLTLLLVFIDDLIHSLSSLAPSRPKDLQMT